jgi:nicotinate-nucleotide adenylyltransferase
MRIGLLGGSFNPVHNAHLRIAAAAQLECQLDKVYFIPAADPPHKLLAGDVSFEHRAKMVSMAIAGKPQFVISAVEAERGGKSYSIDTIMTFREHFPEEELFFIIGGDMFLAIGTWHRFEDIFNSCNIIVVERPGSPVRDPLYALPGAVSGSFRLDVSKGCLIHKSGNCVYFIDGTPMELSSTEIRRLAAKNGDITNIVPPEIAAYISQQRIYNKCQ